MDACTTAKEMWKRVERLMRGTIQNQVDRETNFTNEFDQFVAEPGEALQFVKLVNASRAKKLEKSHDPLALVAPRQDDVQTNSEDPLASAMLLLALAITQNFSNPTNNHLRTSSNTKNQAIIQGDRVNIQSKKSGLFELHLQEILQLFNAKTVVEKDIMLGIIQSQEFGIQSISGTNVAGKTG
ncbi:hypothetical protein Tco_0213541 [Tanacetum coccineum]